MQEIDRIREANEAIDRRARQRHAAALAQSELTPEAIEAEKERQRVFAGEVSPPLPGGIDETPEESLSEKLSAALEEVLEDSADVPEPVALGRLVFQWVLVESDEVEGDHQLALQIQVDEQPPAGFVADITSGMLASWAQGKGLQGNRVEHKHFAAGLFDRAIAVGATETANGLIYALEQLMLDPPTKTSVGDDEPAGEDE